MAADPAMLLAPPIANDNPFNPDTATVAPTDDGGAVVDFSGLPATQPNPQSEFGQELSSFLTSTELQRHGTEVVEATDRDERSREPWRKAYARGLNLLGLQYEDRTEPWEGACGAFHPLLLESVIRFQAQAMTDLFPASGPVKTKVVGKVTDEVERQAERIARDMNWILLEKMRGFRDDTELLLFNLPLAGTTFRTWFWDLRYSRPGAEYTLPEHIVMPYSATSLDTSDFSRILYKSLNWIEAQQINGYFREDARVQESNLPAHTDVTKEKDRIEGKINTQLAETLPIKLYERHMDWFFDWDEKNTLKQPLPYLVTVDAGSRDVLSIRRNWNEADPACERVKWVVQHKYMPGFGAYGMGLINILGGLTESATSILRQLVDSGTLSNLPAGYKAKTARTKDDSTPLSPGEWRDVEVNGGTLKESFLPLPYGEPSEVLRQLLGQIVDEGRRIGSVADMKISDMSAQNMPVGTALAIIERTLKVNSAVAARMYHSFKVEYGVLARIIKEYMPSVPYSFELDERDAQATRATDYDDRVDVIPVADPNASTMAQRILTNQAIIQLSAQNPQGFDMPELNRTMITSLGSEDAEKLVPRPEETLPRDPVTENMDLLNGKPVRAGMEQDHEAHIAVHMAAVRDPAIAATLEGNPSAPAILSAAMAHVQEHLAYLYRIEIEREMGVPLPDPSEPLPPDVEYELSQTVQLAAAKLLGKHEQEVRAQEILDKLEDPIVQNEMRTLDIKEREVENKAEIEAAKLADKEKDRRAALKQTVVKEIGSTTRAALVAEVEQQDIVAREEIAGATLAGKLGSDMVKEANKAIASRVDRDLKRDIARNKPRPRK